MPCENGGSCTDCVPTVLGRVVVITDGAPGEITDGDTCPVGFNCACPEGFFGDRCEVDVDYCMSFPCQNNGTCHDVMGGPGYSCRCLAGYTGLDCEAEVDECEPQPCMNGGTCQVGPKPRPPA